MEAHKYPPSALHVRARTRGKAEKEDTRWTRKEGRNAAPGRLVQVATTVRNECDIPPLS